VDADHTEVVRWLCDRGCELLFDRRGRDGMVLTFRGGADMRVFSLSRGQWVLWLDTRPVVLEDHQVKALFDEGT
jgi:hypothetical protein